LEILAKEGILFMCFIVHWGNRAYCRAPSSY